jgi:uncharacterized membrane protein
MFKNFLQGKFLQHPLHPLLVHIPISLLLLSFMFDIASLIDRTNSVLGSAAYYTILGGIRWTPSSRHQKYYS